MNDVEEMWRDFAARPFPEGYAGVEVEGIELASLDTFAAGCIHTFVLNKDRLDSERISILRQCATDLGVVVKELNGEAKDYFEHLLLLSEKVLRWAE